MKRAALYTRVSTTDQAQEGVSLEAQEERLRAYCTLAELDLVALIREEGVSASKPLSKRPGGQELLRLLKRGEATHVAALKLDRLFRSTVDALSTTQAWDKAGISLHLVDFGGAPLDTSSPTGRLLLTMLSAIAEWERSVIAERTATALRFKREHGQVFNGQDPFGFDRAGDLLVPNDIEITWARQIRGWRAEGWSLRAIAAELTRQGVPAKCGTRWYAATVGRVLASPLLAGGA